MSHGVSQRTSIDRNDVSDAQRKQRIRNRKACERCHKKKVKCDFQKPCATCIASNLGQHQCEYKPFTKAVYVKVRREHLKGLTDEVERLKTQLASVTSQLLDQPGLPEKNTILMPNKTQDGNKEDDPMSLSKILDNRFRTDPEENPLVLDQNIPHSAAKTSHYMGDSACSKFNTKLQQYVAYCHNQEKPALGFVGDQDPVKYEDDELHWNNSSVIESYTLPDKSEAYTLINIAYDYVGIEYYLVLTESIKVLIENIYADYKAGKKIHITPKGITRSQMAQFFAMCALGALYSGSTTDGLRKVPGTKFIRLAVSLLNDYFEEASLDYVEALNQIGFYFYSLNRVKSAFIYVSIALKMAITMGLHRRASFWNNIKLDVRSRERRRRLFYTLYIFDRLICAKLGYPVTISDEDMDTELPSELNFTEAEYKEFPDSKYILAQIQLASITTLIIKNIYGSREVDKDNGKSFVKVVHHILSRLKIAYERLDSTLKLSYYNNKSLNNVMRNIFSFHMHYNQLIILATRPLLLYVFTRSLLDAQFQPSQLTAAIAEACIQSAYSINSVISTLYRTGKLSTFGFFDAHYCFSSTIILIISTTLTTFDGTSKASVDERIVDATNILQSLADLGSIPARNFLVQLRKLHHTIEEIDVSKMSKVFYKVAFEDIFAQAVVQSPDSENQHRYADTSENAISTVGSKLLQVAGTSVLDDGFIQEFLSSTYDVHSDMLATDDTEDFLINIELDKMQSFFDDLR